MDAAAVAGLVISGLALALSGVAAYLARRRDSYERRRALRSELTDLLSRLVRAGLENARLLKEYRTDPAYVQAVSSALNQENAFLLNEARILIDQIPEQVGSVEYNTLAAAAANASWVVMADDYYRRAVDASTRDNERAMALRSYGGFLFQLRRVDEARDAFQQALEQIGGSDDLSRSINGFTIQMWAWNEANAGNHTDATRLFGEARSEFEGISNQQMRQIYLGPLDAAVAEFASAQPAPGDGPAGPWGSGAEA
jgi:tetratricopeptide (TPR) repeat protein